MEKIKVLWIDDKVSDDLIGDVKKLYEIRYFTNITFVNDINNLKGLMAENRLLGTEVIIGHMSTKGLSEFLLQRSDELSWARVGIVTDNCLSQEITEDAIKCFMPDFLSEYDNFDFIFGQIRKGKITSREKSWRGKEVLTSCADVDPEGSLTRAKHHYEF